jgi:pimeloyl-ACP methyl ester carboxylesterase
MNAIKKFITLALISVAASMPAKDLPSYQSVTDQTAINHYLYAAMSSSAYLKAGEQFAIPALGWQKLGWPKGQPIAVSQPSYAAGKMIGLGSGLAFDIWERIGSSEVVFAFRGTDRKEDWLKSNLALGFSIAYKSAKKKVRAFMKGNPGKKMVMFTGHSLGGGLALCCSCEHGIPAVVFDSSPRVFDGLGDAQTPAQRISIHQKGDPLEGPRRASTKFADVITTVYEAQYDFGANISKHSGYHLALNLVKQAAKNDIKAAKLLAR